MMDNAHPMTLFKQWFEAEKRQSKVDIPTAVCMSTMGTDGFPNARFVSLKEIIDDKLIVTGPLTSRKGIEIKSIPKVALTFWWTATKRQVRIQGLAEKITDSEADRYFEERNTLAKAVASISRQGQVASDLFDLQQQTIVQSDSQKSIQRPDHWGGYAIRPVRVELMQFKESRFHQRHHYEFRDGQWHKQVLQP
ncbi:pyridoxal 5'-phosphate synthase [Flagellimonas sp. DF-77]|uniref:pyridoxine/pyridoxamine 5'-phosphate oxidase n=1 Tax=Flagellimonas algarum TaxID=3230298 RepID=UPI00339453C9